MDVKHGYKQTEVGVIPDDWDVSDLQQACRETITYGIVQCGPHIRDGVPYIRVSDMDERELTVDAMLRTSKSIASKFARSTVEEGDLVYALRGKLGEVRQVRAGLAGANLTQGTARLSPNDRLDSDYLLWAMRNPRTVRQAELEAKGTTFREITLANLRRIQVPVPPKTEQRAIAEALSNMDGLLGGLDRLIAKKRDLKQATMQQLLTGQTRLPGFGSRNATWHRSAFGEFPRDWELLPLFRISAFITKGSTPTTYGFDWVRSGVLFLRSECVSERGLDLSESMFVSPKAHQLLRRSEVKSGDILMTITGNVGRVVHLDEEFPPSNINQHIARIRITDGRIASAFVFHFLSQPLVRKYYNQITTGQAYPQISLTQVRDTVLPMPSFAEQTAIAEVLTDMEAELAALEERREKTRALKQAMMQELLTGRTRLV